VPTGRTLKELLNSVLGQSAFLQEEAFAGSTDPDLIQMVEFANRAASEYRRYHPWSQLRKSTTITLVGGQTEYDLPADFDWYVTESMWKSDGARHVVIPTSDRYWAFIKAGNPGTRINYYAKIIGGQLAFTAVTDGDVINLDYCSLFAVEGSGAVAKERFTADTDLWYLDDDTLVLGIKAYWKAEKEMPSAAVDMADFRKHLKRDIGQQTPAKVIRPRDTNQYTPYAPPISEDYLW
jgi:hypothetical protein